MLTLSELHPRLQNGNESKLVDESAQSAILKEVAGPHRPRKRRSPSDTTALDFQRRHDAQ